MPQLKERPAVRGWISGVVSILIFLLLRVFLPYFLPIWGVSIAAAQDREQGERSRGFDPRLKMEEVVITGTRTEKKLLEAPVRTEVVTREEIERIHARDLKEALEDVPGLLLREIHGKQGQAVWMQGLDSDRVLILLNGERQTATTGSTVDLTQIGTADIERIEIVKGATSALYGSEAMGGVINVITRQPAAPFSLTLQMDAGSYGNKNLDDAALDGQVGMARTMADLSLKRPRWNLKLASDLRRSEGFDLDKSTIRTEGDEGLRWNLDPRVALTFPGGGEISLSPRYYFEDKERLFATFVPGLGVSRRKFSEEVNKWHVTLGGKRPFTDGSRLSGSLAYKRLDDVSTQDVLASPQLDLKRSAVIDLARGEVQWDLPAGERHLFTIGAVAARETLEQEQVAAGSSEIKKIQEITPGASRENYEGYLQDDFSLTSWLELLPGTRYQYDSDFGSFFAPKVNVMIRPASNLNLRLGVGKGYRVPNLRERFFFFDHSALGYQVIGNPDLQPESSNSLQAGIEFWKGELFHGELNLYRNQIKDLIDTRLNPVKSQQAGLQIFDYQNIHRAITQGAESSASLSLGRYVTFRAGYTYLWAKDTELDKWLPRRPRHQVKGGIDLTRDDWGTSFLIRAVYEGKSYVNAANTVTSPPWVTWDIKINQEVGKYTTLFIGVDNVTDAHRDPNRSEFDDFRPVIPRFVYAGVRVRI